MSKRVFAHVPYAQIGQHLPFFLKRRLNPEIFLSGDALEALRPGELTALAAQLNGAGLSCTIHAPFMDLNPGSFEPILREQPTIADRLSRIMAKRRLANTLLISSLTHQERQDAEQQWPDDILSRIRRLFSLPH